MYELASSQKAPRTFGIVHKRIISLAYNDGHWRFVEKSSALFGFIMMHFAEDDSPPQIPSYRNASYDSSLFSFLSFIPLRPQPGRMLRLIHSIPQTQISHPLLPSTSRSHPRGRNKKSLSNWLSNNGITQEEPEQEPTFRSRCPSLLSQSNRRVQFVDRLVGKIEVTIISVPAQ